MLSIEDNNYRTTAAANGDVSKKRVPTTAITMKQLMRDDDPGSTGNRNHNDNSKNANHHRISLSPSQHQQERHNDVGSVNVFVPTNDIVNVPSCRTPTNVLQHELQYQSSNHSTDHQSPPLTNAASKYNINENRSRCHHLPMTIIRLVQLLIVPLCIAYYIPYTYHRHYYAKNIKPLQTTTSTTLGMKQNDDRKDSDHVNRSATTTVDDAKQQQQQQGTSTILQQKQQKEPLTLRKILLSGDGNSNCGTDKDTIHTAIPNGFHLAVAPAFFGFYGYFGIISAWYDTIQDHRQEEQRQRPNEYWAEGCKKSGEPTTTTTKRLVLPMMKSVVGASAGAMVAILLGANIAPQDAMQFCTNITLRQYADFPGFLSLFRGNLFEQLLYNFLIGTSTTAATTSNPTTAIITQMEDSVIPIAVTAFDIQTMSTQILATGSMARAARASATFPGLFQPVGWSKASSISNHLQKIHYDYLFIDGGVMDHYGIMGLNHTIPFTFKDAHPANQRQLVIHLQLLSGKATTKSKYSIPGPKDIIGHPDVVTISVIGLPLVTPFTMHKGPIAYQLARQTMFQALDEPLQEYSTTSTPQKRTKTKLNINNVMDDTRTTITPKHYHLVIDVNRPK